MNITYNMMTRYEQNKNKLSSLGCDFLVFGDKKFKILSGSILISRCMFRTAEPFNHLLSRAVIPRSALICFEVKTKGNK